MWLLNKDTTSNTQVFPWRQVRRIRSIIYFIIFLHNVCSMHHIWRNRKLATDLLYGSYRHYFLFCDILIYFAKVIIDVSKLQRLMQVFPEHFPHYEIIIINKEWSMTSLLTCCTALSSSSYLHNTADPSSLDRALCMLLYL